MIRTPPGSLRLSVLLPLLLLASGILPPVPGGSALAEEPGDGFSMDPPDVIRRLENPARDGVMKPDEVIAALRLAPGQVIGDIGAGTGYFARRLARRVAPGGRVFAVDIQPRYLEELKQRALEEGITNIVAVLSQPDDSLLPEASCDLLFLHHVYVHLPDPVAYLRHLKTRLKPGGRIVIIGWRRDVVIPRPQPVIVDRRARTTEEVAAELGVAGFTIRENLDLFPERYFLIAVPRT